MLSMSRRPSGMARAGRSLRSSLFPSTYVAAAWLTYIFASLGNPLTFNAVLNAIVFGESGSLPSILHLVGIESALAPDGSPGFPFIGARGKQSLDNATRTASPTLESRATAFWIPNTVDHGS